MVSLNQANRSRKMREPQEHSIEHAASQIQKGREESPPPTVEPEVEEQETVLESETEVETEQETEEETTEETEGDNPDQESEEETEVEEEVEEEEETPYYAVKIDGDEYEVSLDELQSGYQRQKDYTKKTQVLADQRKATEAQSVELTKQHEDFLKNAQIVDEMLNRDLKKFEKVDWEGLKESDPVAYVQKQIEVQEVRQQKADLTAQAQAVYEHNQRTQADDRAKHMELQRKEALNLFPEWKSAEKANANQTEIITYARSMGYTDMELANLVNAKDLLILDKARRYDTLQSTKQGITKKKKPVIRKMVKSKGVAPKGTNVKKKSQVLQGNLRKSGSLQDAAALLYQRSQNKGK